MVLFSAGVLLVMFVDAYYSLQVPEVNIYNVSSMFVCIVSQSVTKNCSV